METVVIIIMLLLLLGIGISIMIVMMAMRGMIALALRMTRIMSDIEVIEVNGISNGIDDDSDRDGSIIN